ncbi:hypothetical protein ZIOFF_067353 [Zingiber officinale]|uniref:Ribosomal protein L9 n=1 Tax=Zingiber officinale TaxID=94328 RepID=A0A8J5C6I8_ZINOF|nr:hypothetical protein ZIOFF_067353 [Zingiber officinale]
MKTILSSQTMDIPEGVTMKVNAKIVEVEGPRGKLTRDFKHLNLDFELIEGGKKLKVDAWFGSRKTTASIRTSLSHIDNLITGVTKGYRYKMWLVYAHFPINASITPNNSCIEIRNFLGEKKIFGGAKKVNVSHVIHDLSFGPKYPGIHNPLDGTARILDDTSGTFKYYIKFTNLKYSRVEIDEVRFEWAECMDTIDV